MLRHEIAWACASLVVLCSAPAAAETCTIPRTDANISSSGCSANGSCDTRYIQYWYDPYQPVNSAGFNEQWAGLYCEIDDWDESWGFPDYNASWGWHISWSPLARLMNAAWVVRYVEYVMTQAAFQLPLPGDIYGAGQWWNFVVNYSDNEWLPGCPGPNDSGATTVGGADEYVLLRTKGMYLYPAAVRSGILVHEATHESISHLCNTGCSECPTGSSCDDYYGSQNANTEGLNYYVNAILTPHLSTDGTPFVTVDGNTCSWTWFFSDLERSQTRAKIDDTSANRYSEPTSHPANVIAQREATASWTCVGCTDDYTFNPHVCDYDQTACNDVVVPANATVNAQRELACDQYNAVAQSPTVTAAQIAQARTAYLLARGGLSCIQASDAQEAAYCASQQAAASRVSDFDPCEYRMTNTCITEWCFDQYDHAVEHHTSATWLANDPTGCLAYSCGDGTCQYQGAEVHLCPDAFVFAKGDAGILYDAAGCESCTKVFILCLQPKYDAGDWAPPAPYPPDCFNPYQQCVEMKEASAGILAHFGHSRYAVAPGYGPGPQEFLFEQMREYSTSPKFQLYDRIREIQRLALLDSGTAELELALRSFMDEPEVLYTLYRANPGKFMYLFQGQELDLACILPPSHTSVTPEPITEADLLPAGYPFLWAHANPRPFVFNVDYPVIAHGGALELRGAGFSDATSVTLGGVTQSFTVDDAATLTIGVVTDGVPVGVRELVVTTANGSSPGFPVTVIHLVLNEVDPDTVGTVDTAEFVEVATGVAGVSLRGYALVGYNGSALNNPAYFTEDLGPTGVVTDANGFLLIANGRMTTADVAFPDSSLRNGTHAVAIHQGSGALFPAGTVPSRRGLVDAVVYTSGSPDDAALLAALLGTGPQAVAVDESGGGSNAPYYALVRCPDRTARLDGRAFVAMRPPSPNAANGCHE
ncbi:MAG: hypothetical protein HY904_07660 [Deltaproteobacteria bacterium]|nr:hypothetical protein [Deltaproteobacteria bacterium]